MITASGCKKLLPLVLAITRASAVVLSSAASLVYRLIACPPVRLKRPISSFVPVPRSSWRSSSIEMNRVSRPFKYDCAGVSTPTR
jgi:hypothetical protein